MEWRVMAAALVGVLVGVWSTRPRREPEPAGDVRGAVPMGGGRAR